MKNPITLSSEYDGFMIQKKGCKFIGTIDKLTINELWNLSNEIRQLSLKEKDIKVEHIKTKK